MKTLILSIMVLIFMAAFSDGCQDILGRKKNQSDTQYLKKVNGNNWLFPGAKGEYCRYKLYEDVNRMTVIDTICIYCPYQDSVSLGCMKENDYKYIWDQEYHREDSIMTWKRMYIEKLNTDVNSDCKECPPSEQKYTQTIYGYTW
ncbi:MAG: hypothetical protein HOP31_15040 [Ignavibacteria bacterium]|nr:hypothetical protein [Ignavibacteria bacterium]